MSPSPGWRERTSWQGASAGIPAAPEALALLLLAGVPLVVIVAGISAVARNPVLLVLLLGGGGGLVAWRVNVRQKRVRELAEMRRRQAEIYAARVQAIGSHYSMSAREFEEAIAWLCRRDGCPEAHVTGKAGDLGADVRAVTPDGRILIIQAKRYAPGNLVTGPDLQKFGGTCYNVHRAQVAVVVTTSAFTKQAREYAAGMRIVLFDHDALGGLGGPERSAAVADGAPASHVRLARGCTAGEAFAVSLAAVNGGAPPLFASRPAKASSHELLIRRQ